METNKPAQSADHEAILLHKNQVEHNVKREMLDHAQKYLDMGWSVIPVT